jgi:hypothetical protein
LGDILKVIDEDVTKRTDIFACFCVSGGPEDHILKVDTPAEPLLIFLEHGRKDIQKRLGAFPKLHTFGLGFTVSQAIATTFVLAQERPE